MRIRNRLLKLITLVILLLNFRYSQDLFSQQTPEENEIANVWDFNEELYIQTDRNIYITSEEVWFKVYKLQGITHSPYNISKVVYLELLDKNNFPVIQLKLKIDGNSGASGFILPDNIHSGNYLIRVYSNWMKNFPVNLFYYKEISVINPFENIENIKLPSDSIDIKLKEDKNQNLSEGIPADKLNGKRIRFKIALHKPEYLSRDKVKISITASDMAGNPIESDLSVSVAKSCIASPVQSKYLSKTKDIPLKGSLNPDSDAQRYLPELEGHLISGHIKLKANDAPLKKIDLSLSFVGKSARCQFGKTDDNGEFYFLVKEPGLNEIVIQPLSNDITGYNIELDQPFSSIFSNLKASPFYLDSSKVKAINNAIIGMQVYNIYEPERQKSTVLPKPITPDFYGKPENTIRMADYIELTSLREVVKEIIPDVYTLKQNGKYDFKLINKFKGQPFENKPLILVDGVPVYDFEKVLSINSKEIERADVINTRYFYSENVFDGIVSFTTKKGNLSAMDFNNSIFRQAYEGCQIKGNFYSPDYSSDTLRTSRIPDFRNTLYWNPDLHTTKDGKAETEFYTSDESAEYTIVVEGIAPDGKKGISSALLIVK